MTNSIEEKDNLIALLQEALKFYANKNNYIQKAGGYNELTSRIELDGGSQAQFALNKVKELAEQNQKIQDEYDKLVTEGLLTNMEDIEQILKDNDKDIQ